VQSRAGGRAAALQPGGTDGSAGQAGEGGGAGGGEGGSSGGGGEEEVYFDAEAVLAAVLSRGGGKGRGKGGEHAAFALAEPDGGRSGRLGWGQWCAVLPCTLPGTRRLPAAAGMGAYQHTARLLRPGLCR
jgi:hypothetical protein